jgi:predicted RNase H-like nuclease (RuvC/YqgF family)
MEPTTTLIVTVIGAVLGSGVISAVVTGLFMRNKVRADAEKTNADTEKTTAESLLVLQKFWHDEFKRLSDRVTELETEVIGRDMKIAEIKAEFQAKIIILEKQVEERDMKIEALTKRIRELEHLIRKYGVDADGC